MEQENITVSDYCDKLVCIDTIADGNCLVHAILKASNLTYQNTNNVHFRRQMSIHYRKLLSEAVLEPDERYPNIEDVANLIRYEYKTESPRNFMEFLRTMYNYTKNYISYPEPFLENEDLNKYSLNSVRKYIQDYKKYLINFNEKIETKSDKFIKSPYPSISQNPELGFSEATSSDLKNIEILKNIYTDLEDVIDSHVKQLKNILETVLSYYLYLPTSYNENVIEKVLEQQTKDEEIIPVDLNSLPKGRYHNFPFNCKLFTICKAVSIMKFEFEYNDLDEIVKLGDIPSHLNSRKFIGDGDALLYVPYLLCVNLIVLDFKNGSVLAVYENEHSSHYVIVNNDNNVHFETVGIMKDDKIATLFEKSNSIVQECLNQKSLRNFKDF